MNILMKCKFSKINELMLGAITDNVFPSASLLIVQDKKKIFEGFFGGASKKTIFDVASIAKPVVTGTLALFARENGLLKVGDALTKFVPKSEHLNSVTIENILTHGSGLPAWKPYYKDVATEIVATAAGRKEIIDSALMEPLEYKTDSKRVYSDVGYIVLGKILEDIFKKPINELAEEFIFQPMNMKDSFFKPVTKTPWSGEAFVAAYKSKKDFSNYKFAPTENCPWRDGVVSGDVHDQNCYAMGGVAGHAGLFSTAEDLNKFVSSYVLTSEFWAWDHPEEKNSQAGDTFSKSGIGHLGFTGGSIWIDPEKEFWVILLTNRIHPSSENHKIRAFRPVLHDEILRELA